MQSQDIIYSRYIKPLFDKTVSLLGILLLSPFLLIIAIAVKIDSKGPVLFYHERIGQYGKPFKLLKFRSMIEDAVLLGPMVTTIDDSRVTRLGILLRKYKLDELPQLINVAIGHMSLVGPRPEVKSYVDLFWKDYQQVLELKPGITDFAALEFRDEEKLLAKHNDLEAVYINEILPRKISLYKQYIEKMSFVTDLKILFQTIRQIFHQ